MPNAAAAMISRCMPGLLREAANRAPDTDPIAMQDADKEDAVIVAVTRDGKVFIAPGNTQTTADQLPQKVKDLIANRTNKTVYIRADVRARYEKVEDVVDNLRAAGIDELGLLTEQVPPNERPKQAAN